MNTRTPQNWYTVKSGRTHAGDKKLMMVNEKPFGASDLRVVCKGWVPICAGEDVLRHNIVIRRTKRNTSFRVS